MYPARRFLLFPLLFLLFLTACAEQRSQLEQVQHDGVLRVITRNSPTTYFIGADGPAGMEYELAADFADYLGVKLELMLPLQNGDIVPMIRHGRADLAAAGLAATELRSKQLRFATPYLQIRQQLIYRSGAGKPDTLAELDGKLGVVAGSSHAELLQHLQPEYPQLQWATFPDKAQHELLEMISNGELDYAVVNSNEFSHARRFYPNIAVAFDLTGELDVGWAFAKQGDSSLYLAAQRYFRELQESGELERLRASYYTHSRQYDYVDARTFLERIAERLPRYRPHFRAAAEATGFDWRLLAALSYQESHWEPDALSPTGVRGMMMLTQNTAARVGVEDRTDPVQSIHGGARYLREVVGKIPERIPNPDRLWFALAAYNIGFGHLEDARILTESQGGDPDSWADVRERLPLLSQKKWYEQTEHGYARGHEPVAFVRNIRRYYDVLVWLDEQRKPGSQPRPPQLASPVL